MYKDYDPQEFEEQEIDLRAYLRIVTKRKYIVLTIMCIVFIAVVLKTYTTVPIYTASSQVLVEKNYGSKGLENQFSRWDPGFIDTQIEIIKSANVALKVVENLQLATHYRHYFFSERTETSFFAGFKSSVKATLKPVLEKFSSEPENESSISVDSKVPELAPKNDKEIIAGIIQGGLSVATKKNTTIVVISYSNKDPAIARLIADAVVKAYMDEILEIKLSTSSYSVKWMTEKANEERAKLEHAEKNLQQFMRENDLVTVEDRLTVLPQRLSEFGGQISKAEAQKKELQELLSQITAAGGNLERLENIPTLATNEVLKSIRERIYKAEQTIQELSKKYGHKHPRMIKAKDEIRILNKEKKYEIERVISSITNSYELAVSKESNLNELLSSTKSEMLDSNEKFMQYQIMKREVDSNRVMYDTLQNNINKESVTKDSSSVKIWVIKKAEMPGSPSKPNKRRSLLMGAILGIFSGIGFAFFIEYLDNTVKDARYLEDKYGVSVLGTIQEISGKIDKIESYITQHPLSPLAESYRLIRSGLLLSSAEHPPKTMLITSMGAKEGKTSTSANIGRMLVQGGNSVLIIDCDLRRPRLNKVFGITSEIGLSSFLSGTTEDNITLRIPGEEMSIIPSGPIPPAPAELLSSRRMKMLIEQMSEKFDFVLLDSPPVESVTDSLALSQFVDGTIVVVRAGRTTNEVLESGMKKLHDVKANFLGFVLNGMKSHDASNYYYGYSTYYSKED
ncbi:GumC family protein [Desulfosediminicola flagellatus]|uniref:GumC family protein n=1 Tax=Desulfosediminicola flagellatus TaxID=2569541 RepID=UPI0010AD2038|nr:polysaccharide biosynthesis tyrosine autokinase [Desulfosediminicola flagellatus]